MWFGPENSRPLKPEFTDGPETGFWDNFSATDQQVAVAGSSFSGKYNLAMAYDDILKEINKDLPTRKQLANPFAQVTYDSVLGPEKRRWHTSDELEQMIWDHLDIQRSGDDTAFADLPRSRADFMDQLNKSIMSDVQKYEDVKSRAGAMGKAGVVAGNIFAGLREPMNIATMAIGTGAASGILRTAIVDGLLGMGAELAIQPDIQQYREKLGLEREDILEQVLYAGAGGAILGGGIKALGKGLSALSEKDLIGLFKKTNPEPTKEQQTAVDLLESDQRLREQNPFNLDDLEAEDVHFQRLAEAEEALDQGKLPEFDDTAPGPIARAEASLPQYERLKRARVRIKRFLNENWQKITGAEPMPKGSPPWTEIMHLSPETTDRINAALKEAGVDKDVSGWRTGAKIDELRHWWTHHGADAQKEIDRGNLPSTPQDLELMADVLDSPDQITITAKVNENRNRGIVFEKVISDNQVVVVEMIPRRERLDFFTAYVLPKDKRPNLHNKKGGDKSPPNGSPSGRQLNKSTVLTSKTGQTAPSKNTISDFEEVVTSRGTKVPVAYDIVELDDLIASHGNDLEVNPDFPKELQPRDRSGAASQQQIQEISEKLEPALLGRSAFASDGAPIIGPDGVVEAGNGRTIAIKRAYEGGKAEGYRSWLAEQGHDLSGFKKPVLVRRRQNDLDLEARSAFARESNERTTMEMRTAERAAVDAANMPDHVLDLYQGGDLGLARNSDFVRAFMGSVSPSEQASMVDASGRLTRMGKERMKAAIAAKAYGDDDFLAEVLEADHTLIKSIGDVLLDLAPLWAKLRGGVKAGNVDQGMDTTQALMEAVRIINRARTENRPVQDLIDQLDMFSGETPQQTVRFLQMMFSDRSLRRAVSKEKLGETLDRFIREAAKNSGSPSMFEDLPPLRATEIMDSILNDRESVLPATSLDPVEATKELEAFEGRLDELDEEIGQIIAEKGDLVPEDGDVSLASLKADTDQQVSVAKEVDLCAKGGEA